MYVTEIAEWLDSKLSVKLGGFRTKLQASCVCSPTEELWFNKNSLSVDDNIYILDSRVDLDVQGPKIQLKMWTAVLLPKQVIWTMVQQCVTFDT